MVDGVARSGFPPQSFDLGVEGRRQFGDQGFDAAHLVLNRQRGNALRQEVVDHEVLSGWNHPERRRTVLPKAAVFRIGRGATHSCVQVGEVPISNVVAPFAA